MNKKSYLCQTCRYAATLKSAVDHHTRVKHASDKRLLIRCKYPNYDYTCKSPVHLKSHHKIVHVDRITPFMCHMCSYQCPRKIEIRKYIKHVHERKMPFECEQCHRRFPKLCVMNKHIELVHDKSRTYVCGILDCEKAFGDK